MLIGHMRPQTATDVQSLPRPPRPHTHAVVPAQSSLLGRRRTAHLSVLFSGGDEPWVNMCGDPACPCVGGDVFRQASAET